MAQIIKTSAKGFIAAFCLSIAVTQLSCSQTTLEKPQTQQADNTADRFTVNHVDAAGASALLKASDDTVIIDIRTPKEIKKGHIEGAVFADFFADDFSETLSKLDKDTPYVIHCGSGGRSTKALTTFKELGFTNITHMDGGMKGWTQANLPLQTPG